MNISYSTDLTCSGVPPDVVLAMAQAASFRVLNSALLITSIKVGMTLASITAWREKHPPSATTATRLINVEERKSEGGGRSTDERRWRGYEVKRRLRGSGRGRRWR